MGNGRHSGFSRGVKNVTHKTEGLSMANAAQYRININAKSFSQRGIPQSRVNGALSMLHSMMTYLDLPESKLPSIDLVGYTRSNSFTIGSCSLGKLIKLNSSYFGNDNHLSTLAHEYVHALEAQLLHKNFSSVFDRANGWNDCLYAKGIINSALKSMGESESSWKSFASSISSYATTDHSECLAEAGKVFAKGGGKSDNKFVSAVMQALKKELHKSL